jgi:hypothetical protein
VDLDRLSMRDGTFSIKKNDVSDVTHHFLLVWTSPLSRAWSTSFHLPQHGLDVVNAAPFGGVLAPLCLI